MPSCSQCASGNKNARNEQEELIEYGMAIILRRAASALPPNDDHAVPEKNDEPQKPKPFLHATTPESQPL
jgi:hypothetical protein